MVWNHTPSDRSKWMGYFMWFMLIHSLCFLQIDQSSLASQLEKLIPQASGVAEVRVLDIKELDLRPGDGPLYLDVQFQILRGTGTTRKHTHITKDHGGHSPPNTPKFKPYGPVNVNTFKKGQTYIVAFCSQYDGKRYPQGIINSWPIKDAPKVLQEAIQKDHYSHQPQFDPLSGFTHSYRMANDKKSWRALLERNGKLIGEAIIPGERYIGERFEGQWCLIQRQNWPSGLGHTDTNKSKYFLFAETVAELEKGNRFDLPPQKYRLTYALDADTVIPAAVWVSRIDLSPTANASVIHYFDVASGKVRREERHDYLEMGGVAAGGTEERWLREIVRIYDLKSNKLKSEETLRWTTSPEGSKYVPVPKR